MKNVERPQGFGMFRFFSQILYIFAEGSRSQMAETAEGNEAEDFRH